MIILALESSAKPASAAICSDSLLLGQYIQNSGLTHSRTLMPMAEALIKNLEMSATDIDLIAVARGPGSFTGVRIGVSAAKGIALGLNIPVCGVSTLEAMAYQVPQHDIIICPVMDARRDQVYNALFEWRGDSLVRMREDRAISLEDLAADLKQYHSADLSASLTQTHSANLTQTRNASLTQAAATDSATRNLQYLLVGDGAEIACSYLSGAGIECRIAPELMRHQSAYGVAITALHKEHIPATELEPSYLRPSQAERERAAQLKSSNVEAPPP
ncbi:MAG: tRNA (adenosine(37)-N6)-threonylcarbamoyltransferase complex dimerization subunit type 1 TsaB [Oscillospiraceae bacterium]|nr:tRNA (adenosine(37)-N6)-threonylcarbamoyltransferase complex dimerization subunit type 1 TsaB [Oscillospiraceae bacterium]